MYYVNRIVPIIRKIVFIVFTIICSYYTYQNLSEMDIVFDSSFRLIKVNSKPYYEMLSDNTGYTNVNGISNFVNNMTKDGYEICKDSSTDKYLDYVFSKEDSDILWRVYYNIKDSYIAIFSSDYESSGKGYAYINEEY